MQTVNGCRCVSRQQGGGHHRGMGGRGPPGGHHRRERANMTHLGKSGARRGVAPATTCRASTHTMRPGEGGGAGECPLAQQPARPTHGAPSRRPPLALPRRLRHAPHPHTCRETHKNTCRRGQRRFLAVCPAGRAHPEPALIPHTTTRLHPAYARERAPSTLAADNGAPRALPPTGQGKPSGSLSTHAHKARGAMPPSSTAPQSHLGRLPGAARPPAARGPAAGLTAGP